ncbi:hypothetical protein OFN23_32315, partial [Escherichia coli]|nr:hypothetical protein [Escherichia coli]
VFTASLLFPSISGVLFSLYNEISDNKLQLMELPSSCTGQTFANCSYNLLKKNILLLGIKRNEQYMINPVHSFVLIQSDIIIVIHH